MNRGSRWLAHILGIAAALAAISPQPAWPHAFLDHAVPPVGGTVAATPAEIRLYFSEAVEPLFSGIEIAGPDGRRITAPPAATAAGASSELSVRLPPLPPGKYRVHWHVVSVDTHRTEGDFTFEVRP